MGGGVARSLLCVLLAATALAGCGEDPAPGPDRPSHALLEHSVPPTLVAADYDLLAPGPGTNDTLATYAMSANPGFAAAARFAGPTGTPERAFASLYGRTSVPSERMLTFSLEFASAGAAESWSVRPPALSSETHYLLLDGRFVTVVLGSGAQPTHVAETALRMAEFVGAPPACHAGDWPPAPAAFGDPRPRATGLNRTGRTEDNLTVPGMQRVYAVELAVPSVVQVDLRAPATAPRLEILDGDLRAVASGVPAGVAGVGVRAKASLANGTFYVRVIAPDPCQAGLLYNLTLETAAANADTNGDPGNATLVGRGSYKGLTIVPADDVDWYKIDLDARLRLHLLVRDSAGEIDGAVRVILYDRNLVELDRRDFPDPAAGGAAMSNDLDAGTHYVQIFSLGQQLVYRYTLDIHLGPAT